MRSSAYITANCSRLKLSMRQTHKVGEKLFVDYSGDGIAIIDQSTGEIRYKGRA